MKISIIIPVFNSEKFLTYSLKSVCGIKDIEVICVNDGSTDASEDIIKKFPKVRYFCQENKGVSEARNLGLEMAEGEYVCFLDSDDALNAESFADFFPILEGKHPDMLVLLSKQGDEEKYPRPRCIMPGETVHPERLASYGYFRGSVWGVLYRNELIRDSNLKFAPGVKNGEDTIFWAECMMVAESVEFEDIDFYRILGHEGSASRVVSRERLVAESSGIRKVSKLYSDQKVPYKRAIAGRLLFSSVINAVITGLRLPGMNFRELDDIIDFRSVPRIDPNNLPSLKKKLVCIILNKSPKAFFFWKKFTRNFSNIRAVL